MISGHGAGLQQAEQMTGALMQMAPGIGQIYAVGQVISGCNFANRSVRWIM